MSGGAWSSAAIATVPGSGNISSTVYYDNVVYIAVPPNLLYAYNLTTQAVTALASGAALGDSDPSFVLGTNGGYGGAGDIIGYFVGLVGNNSLAAYPDVYDIATNGWSGQYSGVASGPWISMSGGLGWSAFLYDNYSISWDQANATNQFALPTTFNPAIVTVGASDFFVTGQLTTGSDAHYMVPPNSSTFTQLASPPVQFTWMCSAPMSNGGDLLFVSTSSTLVAADYDVASNAWSTSDPAPPVQFTSTNMVGVDGVCAYFAAGQGIWTFTAATAPAAPTLVAPANSDYLDVTNGLPVTVTYNSTDTYGANAYAAEIKEAGASAWSYYDASTGTLQSTIVWNTCSVSPGAEFELTFPGPALANGNTYSWSVAFQESADNLQGPFASPFTLNAQANPSVTVTGPTGTVTSSALVASWTSTPAQGASQTASRVIVYPQAITQESGFAPGASGALWDSGVVNSNAQSVLVPVPPDNGVTYVTYVQITETGGETSAWSYATCTVSIIPPQTPTVTAAATTDPDTGAPAIAVTVQCHDNILSAVDATFQGGIGTWFALGDATLATETAVVMVGTEAGELVGTSAANGSGAQAQTPYTASPPTYPVAPSTLYTAIAHVRAASTTEGCWVRLEFSSSTTSGVSYTNTYSSSISDSSTEWTQLVVTMESPATAIGVDIAAGVDVINANETHYFDECGIFPGQVTMWSPGGFVGSQQVTITRSDGVVVRGGPFSPDTLTQAFTVLDREVTPGVDYTYTAVVGIPQANETILLSAVSEPSATVSVTSSEWWLLNPLDPSTAMPIDVTSHQTSQMERSSSHTVLGLPGAPTLPVILASGLGGSDGSITVVTTSPAEFAALTALTTSQATLWLSSPLGDGLYVRFGPLPGGMSTGMGNKVRDTKLAPSSLTSPYRTSNLTYVQQPRP